MTPIPVQLGLFGGENELVGLHVVSAHTRVRADGSEVFVGEHLRWNRGRSEPRGRPGQDGGADVDEAQGSLFPR